MAAPEEELAELEGDHEMSIEDILAKFYGGAPKSADQDPSWKGPPGLLEQQEREEQAALGRGARRARREVGRAGFLLASVSLLGCRSEVGPSASVVHLAVRMPAS